MLDPLSSWREALRTLCNREPFVLPPPYRAGHFRICAYAGEPLLPKGLRVSGHGRNCLFVELCDETLLCAVEQAAEGDKPLAPPADGPVQTLLWQIENHVQTPAVLPLPAEERYLLRLCLDLARPGVQSLLADALKRLDELYARYLAKGLCPRTLFICARCFSKALAETRKQIASYDG